MEQENATRRFVVVDGQPVGGGYMCEQANKKTESEKVEGDGRTAGNKKDHKGDWGKHQVDKDKPTDKDKDNWKPWRKR